MGRKAGHYLIYCISIAVTAAVAIITALAAKTGCFIPGRHPFISMLGPMLTALIAADIILFIYWLARLKWVAVIPLIAIGFCLQYAAAVYYPANELPFIKKSTAIKNDTVGKQNTLKLKIATLNAGKFGGESIVKNVRSAGYFFSGIKGIPMADAINYAPDSKPSTPADIVCIQEYAQGWDFGEDSVAKYFSAFPYHCLDKKGSVSADLAIFSRYPIKRYCFARFPRSDYGFIYADIAVDSSRIIRVICIHLESTGVSNVKSNIAYARETDQQYSQSEIVTNLADKLRISSGIRGTQADIVRGIIEKSPYPVLLAGDFNDTPNSYSYRQFTSLLTDTFRECGKGFIYTYRHFGRILRIDYIMHSSEFKGVDYFSPDGPWSDHNTVISDLELL